MCILWWLPMLDYHDIRIHADFALLNDVTQEANRSLDEWALRNLMKYLIHHQVERGGIIC